MLRLHPVDEPEHRLIVGLKLGMLFVNEVQIDPRVDAGDAIKDGLGKVHLPLGLPGIHNAVIVDLLCVDGLGVGYFGSDFLLVHSEHVEGLVEFDPFAGSDLGGVVLVDHLYLYLRSLYYFHISMCLNYH